MLKLQSYRRSFLSLCCLTAVAVLIAVGAAGSADQKTSPKHTDAKPAYGTPAQWEEAVSSAKDLMNKILGSKNMADVAGMMTNRTAGSLGLMMVGDAENVAASIGHPKPAKTGKLKGKPVKPDPAALARAKKMYTELQQLDVKYGVDKSKSEADKSLAVHGRDYLRGAIAVFTQFSGSPDAEPMQFVSGIPADYVYTVLSPSKVLIVNSQKTEERLIAMPEAGVWRADLMDPILDQDDSKAK